MQDSGRTQDFVSTGCPPVTHRPSTACSAGRAKGVRKSFRNGFFQAAWFGFFGPQFRRHQWRREGPV